MNEQEETIDLRVLLKVLTSHIIPIAAVTIAAALIGFVLAKFIVPKRYTSEALMYVENTSSKQDDTEININNITAAQKLVNTCQILFTSDYVFGELSSHFNGQYTKEELSKMVKIESVNSTEVLRVSIVSGSPQESYDIASELIVLVTNEFQRIIKGGSIETVSEPTLPEKHTYPSAMTFTAVGGLIGLVLTYGLFLVLELLDTKLKPDDDLTAMYELPVFAEILDFTTASRSGYKYSKYSSYDSAPGSDLTYADEENDTDKRSADKEAENGKEK